MWMSLCQKDLLHEQVGGQWRMQVTMAEQVRRVVRHPESYRLVHEAAKIAPPAQLASVVSCVLHNLLT